MTAHPTSAVGSQRRAVAAAALALMLAVATGCSGRGASAPPGDALPDGPLDAAACAQLDVQITDAIAALGGTCQTAADCVILGGQLDQPTCNCAPFVASCEGVPVATSAPGLAHAKALIVQFVAAGCAEMSSACDCAPRGPLRCTADHRCTAEQQSCFPGP